MLKTYTVRWKPGIWLGGCDPEDSTALHLRSVSGHRRGEAHGEGHDATERLPNPGEVGRLKSQRLTSGPCEPSSFKDILSHSCELPLAAQLIQGFLEAAWHSCLPEISQAPNTGIFDHSQACPFHFYAILPGFDLVQTRKTPPLLDHLVTTTESVSSVLWEFSSNAEEEAQ